MTNLPSADSSRDLSAAAPGAFQLMLDYLRSDMNLGLRYSLLRLELAGLTEQDRGELLALGRLATGELDVASAAQAIIARKDASPLASTIASIVNDGAGGSDKRALMLGAVFGAHAFVFKAGDGDPDHAAQMGVIGAVAGGAAAAHFAALERFISQSSWDTYTTKE